MTSSRDWEIKSSTHMLNVFWATGTTEGGGGRSILALVAALLAVLAFAPSSKATESEVLGAAPTDGKTVEVAIDNFTFTPNELTIAPGEPDKPTAQPQETTGVASAAAPLSPPASETQSDTPQAQEDRVHAVPITGEAKPHLLVREQAEKQRLAALQSKDQADVQPEPQTKRYFRVKVLDGGTLVAGAILIRLDGIETREADARCVSKDGRSWPCGAKARVALTRLIRYRAITCPLPASGEQPDFAARCTVGVTDLSMWMVRQGWAKPKTGAEPALADALEAAKKEQIGLWGAAE
jgi:endonuclease YncB( thermonuclease family)